MGLWWARQYASDCHNPHRDSHNKLTAYKLPDIILIHPQYIRPKGIRDDPSQSLSTPHVRKASMLYMHDY